MEALAILAAVVISCIVIAGIIYLVLKVEAKLTKRNIKKLIKNNDRLNEANRVVCKSREGNTVKLDVLRGDREKFAELTVTGTSAARNVRPDMELKIS